MNAYWLFVLSFSGSLMYLFYSLDLNGVVWGLVFVIKVNGILSSLKS